LKKIIKPDIFRVGKWVDKPTFRLFWKIAMRDMIEKIKDVVGNDIHVLDLKENVRNSYVRVIIDTEEAVTIDLVAKVTRAIQDSAILDEFYPNGSRLEVTSPGIGTNLTYPFQFRKNLGRIFKLLIDSGDGEQKVKGKLIDVTADGISVQLNGADEPTDFPFENVKKAIVVVLFS
jgi:ribosome maturation factor RimP